jgi:hypothetical protein
MGIYDTVSTDARPMCHQLVYRFARGCSVVEGCDNGIPRARKCCQNDRPERSIIDVGSESSSVCPSRPNLGNELFKVLFIGIFHVAEVRFRVYDSNFRCDLVGFNVRFPSICCCSLYVDTQTNRIVRVEYKKS